MALKGCQQTGQNQFQDIFLSLLILSGWNLMPPSICNYNYLPCWHVSCFDVGLLRWVFSLQTNRGQLDGKLQILEGNQSDVTPSVPYQLLILLRGGWWEPMRWRGNAAAVLCWRAKKRGQVGACPLPRTHMKPFIFHTAHLASILVQRQFYAF